LRHVAELVAQEASTTEIFDAVVTEAARVLEIEAVGLMRIGPDATATVVALSEVPFATAPVGTQFSLDGENAIAQVARTGKAVRVDDWATATGAVAAEAMNRGVRSTVGTPIVAQGRLWGALLASTSSAEPLPDETESRIAKFAGLIATAISNAESRDALKRLADEQAALRRVAELVARETPPSETLDAVSVEAARVLAVEAIGLVRFDVDGLATLVAQSRTPWDPPPLGTRFTLDGDNPVAEVARTGTAARMDDWTSATGGVAAMATILGVRSTVATPIVVGDRLWGALIAATSMPEPLPHDAEQRVAEFTGLVATAISNTESRDALKQLAEEQAALRRVATLVAAGVPPTVIFTAVSREIEQAFRLAESSTDRVTVIRFDPGPTAVVVGAAKDDPEEPIGTAWEPKPLYVSTRVLATEGSARIDEHDLESGGPDAEALRARGIACQVGSPIVVRRRLWGAVTLNAREQLPPNTEQRLEKFTELVATAVANAEAQSELAASRRRIVAASDEARRRIERDLHDGTQQRLVSLSLALRGAEAMVPEDLPELRVELSDITAGLSGALEDLQEISRGIHPAILSRGGLLPALRTLARRSAIPVDLETPAPIELPESVEVAAYFVMSEALANAAKHAKASHMDVSLTLAGRTLVLVIRDDGIGGADVTSGSGLIGLSDRVEALGGSVMVDSPPGEGTTITARLPMEPDR
jgi:signal transduction histidine kinase